MKHISVILFLTAALTGCDYKSKNISVEQVGGQTYLINQEESKVFIVNKNKIIELEKATLALKDGEKLSASKIIADGKLKVNVKVKFIDSQALYILHASPVLNKTKLEGVEVDDTSNFDWFETLKTDYSSNKFINIQFYDLDGFKIREQEVKVASRATRIIDGKGSYSSYMYEGVIDISREKSKYIREVNFVWNL